MDPANWASLQSSAGPLAARNNCSVQKPLDWSGGISASPWVWEPTLLQPVSQLNPPGATHHPSKYSTWLQRSPYLSTSRKEIISTAVPNYHHDLESSLMSEYSIYSRTSQIWGCANLQFLTSFYTAVWTWLYQFRPQSSYYFQKLNMSMITFNVSVLNTLIKGSNCQTE